MPAVKLLLVDTYPVILAGIRQFLGEDKRIDIIAEASSAAAAIALLGDPALAIDAMILDLDLPDQSGFAVLEECRRLRPSCAVLIFSGQPEEHVAVKALRLGAAGYLGKSVAPGEFRGAIDALRNGKKYIGAALAEWLALDASGRRQMLPHERLSDREFHVLCQLAAGKSVSVIAASVARSPTTISTYRSRILRKMGIRTNAGLTQYALQHHLIR